MPDMELSYLECKVAGRRDQCAVFSPIPYLLPGSPIQINTCLPLFLLFYLYICVCVCVCVRACVCACIFFFFCLLLHECHKSQFCSVAFSWEAAVLEKAQSWILYTTLASQHAASQSLPVTWNELTILGSQGWLYLLKRGKGDPRGGAIAELTQG